MGENLVNLVTLTESQPKFVDIRAMINENKKMRCHQINY
jgi:hypothetical protein